MHIYRNKFFLRVIMLSLALVIVILVGPAVAFSLSVTELLETEAKTQLYDIITGAARHMDEGSLPPDIILSILPDSIIVGEWTPNADGYALSPAQLKTLEEEKLLFYREHKQGYFEIIAEISGGYLLISTNVGPTIGRVSHQTMQGVWFSFIASMVIIAIGSRFFLRPIAILTDASRRVAGGSFAVQVPVPSGKSELSDLMQSFNDMVEELGKVEIFRSGFVSDVSHEFKIPLTTISGYAKLLQDTDSAEERTEYTDIIMEETGHLVKLVDNILILNRLDHPGGTVSYRAERIELAEQIRRVLTLYEPLWSEKHIELEVALAEIHVDGYDTLLKQVWSNLIDNAVKFTPEGGQISIRLEMRSNTACFFIQNSGAGISRDAQRHIFDKFYKQDPARSDEGNGLGLAIVKRIVEMHGGSVTVSSIPGQGVEFAVTLPRVSGNM